MLQFLPLVLFTYDVYAGTHRYISGEYGRKAIHEMNAMFDSVWCPLPTWLHIVLVIAVRAIRRYNNHHTSNLPTVFHSRSGGHVPREYGRNQGSNLRHAVIGTSFFNEQMFGFLDMTICKYP